MTSRESIQVSREVRRTRNKRTKKKEEVEWAVRPNDYCSLTIIKNKGSSTSNSV